MRFVVSHDIGTTVQQKLAVKVTDWLVHPKFLFVIGEDPLTARANLFVSKDNGNTFREALLPSSLIVLQIDPTQIIDDRTEALWLGGFLHSIISDSAIGS